MGTTMLVIEDDPASLDLMTYLLEMHGISALTANRGDTGLALLKDCRPDAVVCDIQLPGLDGYSIARSVKADAVLRHIKLMAVTALAMVGDREKVMDAGFDAYVTKPIDPQTFLSHIELLLGRLQLATPSVPKTIDHARTTPPSSRGTVLVVDDCLVNHELKRSIFEPHGYRIVAAISVASGLQLAREHRPVAIITDVGLPDGSGLDLLRRIKAEPSLRDIPVIVITSTHAEPTVGHASLSLGAARFLVRPLDAVQVLREVESVIAGPAATRTWP